MSSLLKICARCNLEKTVDNFCRDKKMKDGYYYECKKCNNERARERYRDNEISRKKSLDRHNRWKTNNPEEYKKALKKAEQKRSGTEERKKYNREYMRNRRKNPIEHVRNNVSRQVIHGLKRSFGSKRGQPVFDKIGYSPQQLAEHLEKQFDANMSWDNYGTYWHIDHIVPHSHFNYDCLEHPDFKKCWSLENLRPLEAIENIRKGNKLID